MSEPENTPDEILVESTGRSILERVSIVWLVPLGALLIALAIAWQHWRDRGALIEIIFEDAAGIRVSETELKFRDVTVGVVESVRLQDDMLHVAVGVRIDNRVVDYVDEDAVFWVVRPEVSARGVTGLDTVLSGVYLEGEWDSQPGTPQDSFEGRDTAPLLSPGQKGLEITLRGVGDEGITGDAPILYKGVEVGEIGPARIAEDGNTVLADAVIYAPYDRRITSTTRFWNTSGFSLSFGPNGASVDFATISSLLAGGITFDTAASGGFPAEDGDVFELYDTEEDARASLFARAEGPSIDMTLIFDTNVAGLRPDAPVELAGLKVGRITNLTGLVDPERFGDSQVRLLATMALQPERLGLSTEDDAQGLDVMQYLQQAVAGGMRARLTNASLLTGGLKVDLVTLEDAPAAELDMNGVPFPVFPTAPAELTDVAATAESVFNRVNNLPIEELLQSGIDFLNSATSLVSSEDVRGTPQDLRGLLGDIRGIVGSEKVQQVPDQLSTLMTELTGTASELNKTLAAINENELVAHLTSTIQTLDETAASAKTAIDGVPELLDQANAVVAKLNTIPVERLSDDLSGLIQATEALIDTPQARNLPTDMSAALSELALVLEELRNGGTVENVNRTLQSASNAADRIADASQELPALVGRVNGLVAKAQSLLGDYDGNSAVNRDVRTALRAVTEAARALDGLASTIERRPNSLILGR
ncbi:MAG: MlaD family protein [Pseudomonadota bacterium]|nr:MlaD family protein [Pseudomonadota bacterium]MEE3071836.1 MlaD family protein [Pseudomonadota bacterium]